MTNSNNPAYKIGDRIECSQFHGTIKYIGPIEGKPAIWLGIDWDDPQRGKHNGSVNTIQYFETKSERSGSFVRPEKVNFGKPIVVAISTRYGQDDDEFTTKINQQNHLLIQQTINAPFLEMVGFDKVFSKQSDFTALRVVNLREQNVCSAGLNNELGRGFPNIEELDLSKNLFSSWEEIFNICSQLDKLNWLNISENLMVFPESYADYCFPNIRSIISSSMRLSWNDVVKIATVFPNLEEFRAPHNNITALQELDNIFSDLKLIDLEGNHIRLWPEICKLDGAPNMEQLVLENIGLESIVFKEEGEKVPIFQNLKKLCIVNNQINDWSSIGELNRLKNLEHLKVSKNPIIDSEDRETTQQIIIAKIANLRVLNGTEISPRERRGAEYDYIKKYGMEWLGTKEKPAELELFLKSHNRYLELIEKYGELEESELCIKPKVIQSSLVTVNLSYECKTITKKLPPSITIQKLSCMAQKLFRLNEKPHLTYISSDSDIQIALEDEMKEIGVYCMQDGDQINITLP